MKITIFGTGYVGLVTGTCLADVGHDVLCMDVDADKIARLERGELPIYEPGLDVMVRHTVAAGRLRFTTDAVNAVAFGTLQFIAVGTPPDEDGSADLQYVLAVARSIGEHMTDYKIVVDKSTVPVGTADKVRAEIEATLAGAGSAYGLRGLLQPRVSQGRCGDRGLRPGRTDCRGYRFAAGRGADARVLCALQPQS